MGTVARILVCLPCILLLIPSTDAVHNCSIYGDPHLRTYNGARGTILLPCRYQATEFNVKIPGQEKWCYAAIYAFGRVHGGGVYTGGAEIQFSLSRTQGNLQVYFGFLSYFISDYFLRGPESNLTWGQPVNITLDVITMSWTFNTAGAILNVPACGFSLVYRLRSARPSGIVISVSDNATIINGFKDNMFCGNLNDTSNTLIDDAHQLNFDTAEQALAYRIGNLSPMFQTLFFPSVTAQLHPNAGHCSSSQQVMSDCRSSFPEALVICLGIFQKRLLLKCLYNIVERQPLNAFLYCLRAVCSRLFGCNEFKSLVATCNEKLTPSLRQIYDSPGCRVP